MGQLHDWDAWARLLPTDEPENVVSALGRWVADEDYDLHHREWFATGRSNAPVARVIRELSNDSAQLVLKFTDTPERVANLRRGWTASPGFRETHLAETEPRTLRLGETWRAAFMQVAGGNFELVRPLNEKLGTATFPAYCATVVRSVIEDWNEGRAQREPTTTGSLVGGIVGRRRADAEEWARSVGVAVDGSASPVHRDGWPERLPNPFQLLSGEEADRAVEDMIVGKAHGDLSGRNVLVPSKPRVAARSYVLIDYDRFSSRAPLARDPMHLLVALALDDMDRFTSPLWPGIARVLVDPDVDGVPDYLSPFRKISRAIHRASAELATGKGWGDSWRQQCLLSLVGAGVVHLGRTLHTEDSEAAKDWCLQLAAVATEAYLRTLRGPTGSASAAPRRGAAADPPPDTTDAPGNLVDRKKELGDLRARLTNGPWGVVVLRGTRGVGKTRLVTAALKGLAPLTRGDSPLRVYRHDVTTASRFDARTLIDYVAGDGDAAPPVRYARSSLVRLEAALRRLGDSRVVVTVDSAENLIDPATRRLADPDLDEALELLATEHGHRVTVLMVTQEEPVPHADDGTWPVAERPIFLDKLEPPYFFTYLTSLDPKGRTDPGQLHDDRQRDRLYHWLRGNPRLADLAYGVVVVAAKFKLPTLADHLFAGDRKDVPSRLANLLVDGLSPGRRRVLQALAAFDTPVPAAAVSALLESTFPGERISSDEIEHALWFLATEHIIRQAKPDQYYLPSADGYLILTRTLDPAERSRLYFLAATELTWLRIPNPRGIADLRIHFAELRATMQAGPPAAAYDMLNALDDILREWNCEDLLLDQRIKLRGNLGNQRDEMRNENDLGSIYVSRGEFDKANVAFGKALAIANALGDDTRKMQIWPNFAGLYWELNDTSRAQCYYEAAHRDAERLNDPMTRMHSLEGMADCHRRRGRYRRALADAEQALALATEILTLPGLPGPADTDAARHQAASLGVAVALKLARWYAELNELNVAERFLERAVVLAHQRSDDWLLASCSDGRADLAFNQNDFALAESEAHRAVDQALTLNDPITLLQARTTLCLVHLKRHQIPDARREIERARRYRRLDRSLIVVALLGLVARHANDHGAAENWFRRLESEARARVDRDSDDFAARDFLGYAICGLRLNTTASLDEAVAAVREARSRSAPTPLLVDRLRFLLELLGERAEEPDRLRLVIAALNHPSRADD